MTYKVLGASLWVGAAALLLTIASVTAQILPPGTWVRIDDAVQVVVPEPPPILDCDATPQADTCPCPDGYEGEAWPDCAEIVEPPVEATNLVWHRIPGSGMATVKIDGIDYPDNPTHLWWQVNAWDSFNMIARAESSGALDYDKGIFYAMGGGHSDGAHNGIFAFDVEAGTWSRFQEPGPVILKTHDGRIMYPDGTVEDADYFCPELDCNAGPFGVPVSQHTYSQVVVVGDYLYLLGGSVWEHGNTGQEPGMFRKNLFTLEWEPIPEYFGTTRLTQASGQAFVFGTDVWLFNSKGLHVLNTQTLEWSRPTRIQSFNSQTTIAYSKKTDTFYAVGKDRNFLLRRSEVAEGWQQLENPAPFSDEINWGWAELGDKIYWWKIGRSVYSLDTTTLEWTLHEPDGDAPDVVLNDRTGEDIMKNGPFRRFFEWDGRIYIINHPDQDVRVLADADWIPPDPDIQPPVDPCEDDPTLPECGPVDPCEENPDLPECGPVDPPVIVPPTGDLPEYTINLSPHYTEPQSDILEKVCGPLDEWKTWTFTDPAQLAGATFSGDRVRIILQHNAKMYPGISLKGIPCKAIIGEPDPVTGALPKTGKLNFALPGDVVKQGGFLLKNIHVSMYDYALETGEKLPSGDCVVMNNKEIFALFHGAVLDGCTHHAIITSKAWSLYLEMIDTTMANAKSHAAYIDSVAYAYSKRSRFYNPGWGHAFRCIALRCHVEDTIVSNTNLDGQVFDDEGNWIAKYPTRPDGERRNPIGMHPFDVYLIGNNHLYKNVTINQFAATQGVVVGGITRRSADMASSLRVRDAQCGDASLYVEGDSWHIGYCYDEEWQKAPRIDPVVSTYENLTVNCTNEPCYAINPKGNAGPIATDAMRSWLNQFIQGLGLLPQDDPTEAEIDAAEAVYFEALHNSESPHIEIYDYVYGQLLPGQRVTFLRRGGGVNKWPIPPHPASPYKERSTLVIRGLTVANGKPDGPFRWPDEDGGVFCFYDFANDADGCLDPRAPTSVIDF